MKPNKDAERGVMKRTGNNTGSRSEQWLRVHGHFPISAATAAEVLMPYIPRGQFRQWKSLEYIMYSFGFIRAFHASAPKKAYYYHREEIQKYRSEWTPRMISPDLMDIERAMHGDWL